MAFEEIKRDNKYLKAAELEKGESITGYPTGYTVSDSPKAKGAITLSMNIDGENVGVSSAGNLSYFIKDGKVKMGVLTRITRTGGKGKSGDPAQFKVEQDHTNVLAGFQEQAPSQQKSMTDKLAALKG